MNVLEEKIREERCMVWQFRQLLTEHSANQPACEKVQRILAKHESLLAHYQQWSVVEVEA